MEAAHALTHDEAPAVTPAPLPHPTVVDAFDPAGEYAVNVDALLEEIEDGTRVELDGELGVRALLLELRRGGQEADRVRRLRDAVTAPYDMTLERISEREAAIRNVLDDYLKRAIQPDAKGAVKVSIPDAGTAYLTTKRKGGAAKVVDVAQLEQHLEELATTSPAMTTVEFETLYVEQLDKAAALGFLLERFYTVTPEGTIVRKDTGEVVEVPGIEAQPEARELAVRLS